MTAGGWVVRGALFAVVALPVWLTGMLSGFTRSGEICRREAGRVSGPDSITQTAFPVTHTCHWRTGETVELVPAWVNPVIWLCLAGIVACAAMAVRTRVRRHKELSHD
ncbi:hypothetical protein [Streptomyces sp. URMC 123]|uniref:hypothetical protein n=1 Tax=Streptomyces sp. URMC 123 TaxID=3423403 RepID=UPI003F1BA01F